MKFTLIAVGKNMPTWVEQGFNEYQKRLPTAYRLDLIEITAPKRGKNAPIQRIIQQEGEAMLAAIPPQHLIVALDCLGQQWNTPTLANEIKKWHDSSQNVALLVGGPDGLAPECLQRAQVKWSLSSLTYPHPLVRIILAEQLYRAWSMLVNHPYHR